MAAAGSAANSAQAVDHPPQRPQPAAAGERERGHPPLRRLPDRGMLGGVCVGLARRFGVDALPFRVVFAMFVPAGGFGVALYALAWALIPVAPESQGVPRRRGAWREALAIVAGVIGLIVALHLLGLGDGFVIAWPLILGVCGMALVWRPAVSVGGQLSGRARPRDDARGSVPIDAPRLVLGGLLFVFALASLLHMVHVLHTLKQSIWAVAIVATMLALLIGPWFVRLGRSLASERAARIRQQERADVAAHLHDSVLQTLALIQTRAGDARQVAALARRQERELRHWLLEGDRAGGGEGLRAALEREAAQVEELHGLPIEVVIVGDAQLDESLQALVQAAREALVNAAKFAGSERVDLFAEVGPGRVEVFVRDRGVGFDPAAIPADRRGVRESILGRMRRHGGRGAVHSAPGEGTEVELLVERFRDAHGQVAMSPVTTA